MRTALYDVLREYADDSITGVDLNEVTQMIRQKISTLPAARIKEITTLVDAKIKSEHASLMEAYADSREFVAIQQFRADDLVMFSKAFFSLLKQYVMTCLISGDTVRDAQHVVSATLYHTKNVIRWLLSLIIICLSV